MTLCEERRELEEEKRLFDIEKRDFYRRVEIEDRRLEQEKNLFDMKLKILEEELVKLAAEKAEVEKKKAFYEMVDDFQARNYRQLTDSQMSAGEMLFRGVANQQSLKKRYKDLIKIFHPDNIDGDNLVILEINKEYDYLSQYLV